MTSSAATQKHRNVPLEEESARPRRMLGKSHTAMEVARRVCSKAPASRWPEESESERAGKEGQHPRGWITQGPEGTVRSVLFTLR